MTLIGLIFLAAIMYCCNHNNGTTIEKDVNAEIDERNTQYYINFINEDVSVYLYTEALNDTIFLSKYKDSLMSKMKFHNTTIAKKIKDVIKYQLDVKNFFRNDANTLHSGKCVRFYLENSNNRLEAKYNEVEHYKDISVKFDSLIIELTRLEKGSKPYFETK